MFKKRFKLLNEKIDSVKQEIDNQFSICQKNIDCLLEKSNLLQTEQKNEFAAINYENNKNFEFLNKQLEDGKAQSESISSLIEEGFSHQKEDLSSIMHQNQQQLLQKQNSVSDILSKQSADLKDFIAKSELNHFEVSRALEQLERELRLADESQKSDSAEFVKLLQNIIADMSDVAKRQSDSSKSLQNSLQRNFDALGMALENQRRLKEFSDQSLTAHENAKAMLKNIWDLSKKLPQKVLYKNDFERKAIEEFRNIQQKPYFKEQFLKLINNLSPDDTETITRILSRQQRVLSTKDGDVIDIFTEDEKKKVKMLQEQFTPLIFKVADDLFCYKNYLLPINHFEASVFWDKHGIEKLKKSSLEKIKNASVIDAGGFIGDSVLILSPMTKKKIYTFEADINNYTHLLKTLKLNKIKNCVSENLALSDAEGELKFYVYGSMTCLKERPQIDYKDMVTVRSVTLDDYVEKNNIETGLIKIDIEGGEQALLRGAEKTIKSQKPVLLISIYHNVSDFFEIKPLIESWNLGYTFKIHKPIDFSVSREILLIAE